jgi:hypothetical protein
MRTFMPHADHSLFLKQGYGSCHVTEMAETGIALNILVGNPKESDVMDR